MESLPPCPQCQSPHTYEDRDMLVCPECAHEWTHKNVPPQGGENTDQASVKDANGQILNDGDNVVIVKDLKVKGSSSPLKVGTKVRNIRIVDGDHNIDCKIEGFGAMKLKSEFVKKA